MYEILGHLLYSVFDTNSFLASGDFCRLHLTFANSLDPEEAGQNVVPDLDPNMLEYPGLKACFYGEMEEII